MRAWILEKFGEIRFGDFDVSDLSDGEILVRVKACGVCYRDIIDIQGGFKYTALPTVPGHEICGVVEKVNGETPFSRGDIVISRHGAFCGRCELCLSGHDNICLRGDKFVHTIPGGYADLVKAHFSAFELVPKDISEMLSPEQLSIVFCAVGTAYRAILTQAEAKAGDTVLITGASGGVGIHAIQISKSIGCFTIAVTTSDDKVEKIKKLGADEVILSKDMRFNEQVSKITDGRGVDIVIENTGSIALESALRSLRLTGTLVLVGNIRVDKYAMNPGMVITREIKIKGTVGISHNELQKLFNLLRERKVKPILHSSIKLEEAPKAHEILKDRRTFGRIALVP